MKTTILSRAAIACFLGLTITKQLHSQGITWGGISPNDTTAFIDANSSLLRPFRTDSSRFQQVYSASDFLSTPAAGGVWLDRLYFRVDSTNGMPFSGIASNLDVRFSTTLVGPNSLNPVFANNVGANETVAFGPANKFLSGMFIPNNNIAQNWSVRIDFTTPFLYLPTNGNLLLDIRMSGGVGAILDAWNRNNDSVASVAGFLPDTSGTVSTFGLATLFEGRLVDVPEPSTWALLGLGGAMLILFGKPKRRT